MIKNDDFNYILSHYPRPRFEQSDFWQPHLTLVTSLKRRFNFGNNKLYI